MRSAKRAKLRVTGVGLALTAVVVLFAACGGASGPGVASIGSTTTTAAAPASGGGSTGSEAALLKYSECMRAHGVPNFPDPSANGSFQLAAGIDPASPAFKAAQAKCQKLVPGGGLPILGSTTHPSAEALAQMVKVSQCVRSHGVPNFPDPTTSFPSNLARVQQISDRGGVIFVFPRSLDMRSPAFTRAAAACGFKLTNH